MKQYKLNYYTNILGGNEMKVEQINKTDCFAFDIYFKYKNINSSNNQIEDIIKVMLPAGENARQVLYQGITIDGVKFIPWITSANMMKIEDEQGCGEYLFIKETEKDFIKFFDDIVSAGKITELKENESEIFINKDYTSRVSLALTDSVRLKNYSWKNRVLILPEVAYNYIANYETISEIKDEEGNIVDIKIIKEDNKEVEHTAFDGFGLFDTNSEYAKKLDEQFGRRIDFTIFRSYPLAAKGLVARFNFRQYIKDNYKEKTKFVELRADGIYLKDTFGEWHNIDNIDLILNETQTKWSKFWTDKEQNLKDVYSYIENNYLEYVELLYGIYISKTNKDSEDLKEYTRCNYQILNALAITESELAELYKNDIEDFKSIIVDKNKDAIKIFMGSMVDEDDDNSITPSHKTHQLLLSDDSFFNTDFAHSTVANLIHKRIDELASGKVHIKGNFKYIGCDPVAYCNYAMTGKVTGTLKEKEYFVNDEVGQRVFGRNPLAHYGECIKAELIDNELIRKYIPTDLTSELIFFNQVDNTAAKMSGCDMDGDSCLVIDNEIIYNSVIEFESTFLNNDDGKKKPPVALNHSNIVTAFMDARGNLIGSLALYNARLNSTFQDIGYLNRNGQYISRKAINDGIVKTLKSYQDKINKFDLEINRYKGDFNCKKEYKKAKENKYNYQKKALNDAITQLVQQGSLIDMSTLPVEEQKEIIRKRFIENRKWSFYNLYLTMINIDAPKNLIKATDSQEKCLYNSLKTEEVYINKDGSERIIEVDHGEYQARFLKDVKKAKTDAFNICGMNRMYDRINKELIDALKSNNDNDNKCYEKFITKIATNDKVDTKLTNLLETAYKMYTDSSKLYRMFKDEKAIERMNECDKVIHEMFVAYEDKEFVSVKAKALLELMPSSRFVIKYFFDVLEAGIAVDLKEIAAYKKDDNGEFELFHKRYIKKDAVLRDENLHKKLQARNELKNGTMRIFKVATKGVDIESLDLNSLMIKDGDMYTLDMKKVGMIYNNSSSEFADGEIFENIYLIEKYKTYITIYYRG